MTTSKRRAAFGGMLILGVCAVTVTLLAQSFTASTQFFGPSESISCSSPGVVSNGWPPYSFTGDTNTGIGYGGANAVQVCANGLAALTATVTDVTSFVPLRIDEGDLTFGLGNLGNGTDNPFHGFFNGDLTVAGKVVSTGTVFASLGTPPNGSLIFCSNCTIANPCAGAGTGAFAKRLNGVWVCN